MFYLTRAPLKCLIQPSEVVVQLKLHTNVTNDLV